MQDLVEDAVPLTPEEAAHKKAQEDRINELQILILRAIKKGERQIKEKSESSKKGGFLGGILGSVLGVVGTAFGGPLGGIAAKAVTSL